MLFITLMQLWWKGCYKLWHLGLPWILYILEFSVLCHWYWQDMCLSSDITTTEVMWYCKVRWVDMPSGVPETRNESAWRHCPEHLHRNVPCERLFHPVGTVVNWADDVTHFTELFAAWLCTAVHWELLVSLHILKEMVTSNAIKKITRHSHFCTIQWTWWISCGVFGATCRHMFVDITRCGSEPYQTSVMCSLCCYCYSPSPRIQH
jgi:hypothetical protein